MDGEPPKQANASSRMVASSVAIISPAPTKSLKYISLG
jgi:hypothetical protein